MISPDLPRFSYGVNSGVGLALGLALESDPLFGLCWNSHREGLEGGGSHLFPPKPPSPEGKSNMLMLVKVFKAKLFFLLK